MKNIPSLDEYTLRLIDLPVRQGGMISVDPDGHVNIYINARHAHDQRILDAEHEFEHWQDDDMRNDKGIQDVEERWRCST